MHSLVQLLGVDLFNSVTGVIFDCDPIVDFEPVTDLRALRSIFVNIEMAEDIDFSPLADLGELKEVHFSAHSLITRQQFKSLKTLLPHVNVTAEMYTDKS